MAKRKRLTVPGAVDFETGESVPVVANDPPALFAPLGAPPIARVAAESAASAALTDLARELTEARDSGRMIQALPLDLIDTDYLVRDRVHADPEELEALMASMRQRGQQVPIEVAALPNGRYGLISGWRRMTALRRLSRYGEEFTKALAILRRPDTDAMAYLSMVEENELRVGLSHYERARIVLRTTEQGVFPDTQTAMGRLFAGASKAKRSKIGSFFRIVQALDGVLRFPNYIPERLGLTLARALEQDTGVAVAIANSLEAVPALQAEQEIARLETILGPKKSAPVLKLPPLGSEALPGIFVETGPGAITLRGPKVTDEFQSRLLALLSRLGE